MLNRTTHIEVFPWNSNFETGIPLVDEQHKKLVDLLNRLAITLVYDTGELELKQVIDELADYANYHFKTEEGVWQPVFRKDEWLLKHKDTHNAFISDVTKFRKQAKKKSDMAMYDQVLRFMIHWLGYHILDSDMRMAKVLHAVSDGLELPQAKQRANEEMSGSIQVFIETLLSMYEDLSARTLELMRERLKRSKIEEALKHSQESERVFSDTVISSIPGLLYLYDDQLRLARWNRKHAVDLGYTDEELQGKSPLDFFDKSKHDRIRQTLGALADGKQVEIEEYVRKKDGSETPYLLTGVPVVIDGKHCFLGTGIDISRLKRFEEDLLESRKLHQEAQRLVHLGHWKLNRLTGEVICSDELYNIFEIDPNDFTPTYESLLERVHPDDRDLVEKTFSDAVANRTPYLVNVRLPMANGYMKHVRIRGIINFAEDGSPIELVGTVHDITTDVLAEQELERKSQESRNALIGTVIAVSRAMEARDPYTSGHQLRVAEIAVAIAEKLGMDAHRLEGLRLGASVHDIGKLAIPVELLVKPTRLTTLEYSIIKTHPEAGADILKDVSFPWPIREIVSQHHERMDGSGYPDGLKGDEVCLEVRIVAVADVFEAMSAHRPYRPSLGTERATEELKRNRGKLYDPAIVDALLELLEQNPERFATPGPEGH